jgi:hypothetical protein
MFPFGLRAEYEERAARVRAQFTPSAPITEDELASLPAPVQRYLRFVGVVGRPHVGAFRARFTGRFRGGPQAPWMSFKGEQHSVMHPPTRLFFIRAKMRGLPIDAFHVYDAHGARMRVRLLGLIPVVDAHGPEFTRGETVTLFNDMCIMAPAALVDPSIQWQVHDERNVEASYTNGPNTIRAVLVFDETNALVDFWSDDRPALAPDNVTLVPQRWSTPVGDYRDQGGYRLVSRGEARYAAPSGAYPYIQFDSLEISYDLQAS